MGYNRVLDKKISLNEIKAAFSSIWKSIYPVVRILLPWVMFFEKKTMNTQQPMTVYKTTNAIKLCVTKDLTNLESLYPHNKRGFEYQLLRKAMVNELTENLLQSDLIEWIKTPSEDPSAGSKLKAELWVIKKS